MQGGSGGGAMIVRGADRVLVMGITGKQGTFWTERMQAYGTRVVGGTNPGKAGTLHCGVPVFATAGNAMEDAGLADDGGIVHHELAIERDDAAVPRDDQRVDLQ